MRSPFRSPWRALPLLALLCTAAPARAASPAPPRPVPPPTGATVAVLETALGRIVVRLDDTAAPRTCANFRKLVGQGFYDGTCFHRVVPGFVIQGGDPNSRDDDPFNDGEGGPGWTVPAEIGLPHVRGAIAMARTADAANPKRESNGSQFYICLADRPDLDRGGYTVFGRVIAGLDVVDRIAALANTPGVAKLAAGANPEKRAQVVHATLQPLAKWAKAATPKPAAPAPKP